MLLRKVTIIIRFIPLRWEVYVKDKEELIEREFLVSVPNPKGGEIVWTCVKDHIINERE